MKKKIATLSVILMVSSAWAYALVSVFSGNLANETALAYSKNYDVDLVAQDISAMSAQAIYSSATVAAATFNNGQISTGSITVNTLAALTTAYATDTLTILNITGLDGAAVAISGHIFIEGRDWRKGTTTTTAAKSLSDIIAAKTDLVISTYSANVVTLTAPVVGSYYNSSPVSCSNSSVTVASAYMTGGYDNAVVSINGVSLTVNSDWYPGATPTTASTALAAAINANSTLSPLVTATANSPTSGITALVSDHVGEAVNYELVSSTPAALVLSGSAMTGGANSACAASGTNIYSPAHGLTLALPVLYTGTPAIGGLTTGTTYFAGIVDADNISLATTSAKAVLADYITMTCTAAPATTNTYTLSPLPITGTAGLVWSASNDNTNWTALSASSATIALSTSMVEASTLWDLGNLNYHYVRLAVKGPTTGGLKLKVVVNSKH